MKPFADLSKFINPHNIAVVGASARPSSQGSRLYENLSRYSSLKGKVYPVNPAYTTVGDSPCWPSISDLPKDAEIDVALIIVNAMHVLKSLHECVERNIPFAIVMSSGFSEAGEHGKQMEKDIAELCLATGLHVYGPNCPGFVNVRDRIGMTFSPAFKDDLNPGSIGLATQGGGLGRNLLQGLSFGEGVGLWFSAGNEVDLEIPDFIAHMADDPKIKVIGVLMEGVKDGRRLTAALDLARQRNKPVVILKIGHSEAGALAAQSHTASIAGSAAINSAVFKQYGAIEVIDLHELLATTRLLTLTQPRAGSGLCIYTFSGGTAALATDIAGTAKLPMAKFTAATNTALQALLPDFANISNPVDTTADILRNTDAASECLRLVCNDPNVGMVLFPIPMDYSEVTDAIADSIIAVSRTTATPIIPVWMSRRMGSGFQKLEQHGLQPFLSLSDAIAVLTKVWPADPTLKHSAASSDTNISIGVDESHRKNISEVAAKTMLRKAGLHMPEGDVATSADQAVAIAKRLGRPVVMKVVSADITHKTETGGVKLNLSSEAAVREAFHSIYSDVGNAVPNARIEGVLVEIMLPRGGREVLIGVHRDDAFGPILTFGLGGIFVETLRDITHRMIPLTPEDAKAMITEIKHFEILEGVRGQPASDLPALEELIMQVSSFAHQHRGHIQEIELNPVWVGEKGQGAIPLDALIIMNEPAKKQETQEEQTA